MIASDVLNPGISRWQYAWRVCVVAVALVLTALAVLQNVADLQGTHAQHAAFLDGTNWVLEPDNASNRVKASFARPGDEFFFRVFGKDGFETPFVFPAVSNTYSLSNVVLTTVFTIAAIAFGAILAIVRAGVPAARSLAFCLLLMGLPIADPSLPRWLSIPSWFLNSYSAFLIPLFFVAFTTQYPPQVQTGLRRQFRSWFLILIVIVILVVTAINAYEFMTGFVYETPVWRLKYDALSRAAFLLYLPMLFICVANGILVFRVDSRAVKRQYFSLCILSLAFLIAMLIGLVELIRSQSDNSVFLDVTSILFLIVLLQGVVRQQAFDIRLAFSTAAIAGALSFVLYTALAVGAELLKDYAKSSDKQSAKVSSLNLLLLVFALTVVAMMDQIKSAISALTKKLTSGAHARDAGTITDFADRVGFLTNTNSVATATATTLARTIAKGGAAVFVRNGGSAYGLEASVNIDPSAIPDPALEIVPRLLKQRGYVHYEVSPTSTFDLFPIVTGASLVAFLVLDFTSESKDRDEQITIAMEKLCMSLCAALEAIELDRI